MPIGEDVPILVPISIILVVFILFLFSLFLHSAEQDEIIQMSQEATTIGNYIINQKFNNTIGITSPPNIWGCKNISEIGIHSKQKIKVNITNEENGRWWCWGNIEDSTKLVTIKIPTLITYKNETIPATVVVSVGK
ncbi:MAG: hypothetical protein J7K73_01860 [Nanoarchaeota archaeon]|nr:hypothetical protein [Nanoarchaeota archaeon]